MSEGIGYHLISMFLQFLLDCKSALRTLSELFWMHFKIKKWHWYFIICIKRLRQFYFQVLCLEQNNLYFNRIHDFIRTFFGRVKCTEWPLVTLNLARVYKLLFITRHFCNYLYSWTVSLNYSSKAHNCTIVYCWLFLYFFHTLFVLHVIFEMLL